MWLEGGGDAAAFATLEELLSAHYRANRAPALAAALAVIDRYDAYLAPAVFETACRDARDAAGGGAVGFLPTREVPPAAAAKSDLERGAVLSPDGSASLVTHYVRTRRFDRKDGEPTVVLEGWWQIGPAWFAGGGYGVLCASGDFTLDRHEPEVAKLAALDAFAKSQRSCKVSSAGLLHVFNGDNDYLRHIKVDAERIESTPDGRVVVLTRAARDSKQWGPAVLAVTDRGLVPLAKHPADIGSLRCDGDRVFGSNGFELLGLADVLAAAGAWGLTSIHDELALEPPPPPPPQSLAVEGAGALRLELSETARSWHHTSAEAMAAYASPRSIEKRSPSQIVVAGVPLGGADDDLERFTLVLDGETPTERAVEPAVVGATFYIGFSPDNARCVVGAGGSVWDVHTDSGVAEAVTGSWPSVLSVQRDERACWALVRIFQAHCEAMRFAPGDDGWRCTNRLPVEGFDRIYVGRGGRMAVVSIANSPPDMAWSMLVGLDDDGVLRHIGRLGRVVTDVWDDGGATYVEVLGGVVYQLDGFETALAAAVQAQPRPLLALVFDVPGHYGRREFLAKFEHDFGYIDRDGGVAIAHQFTSVQDFENGHARVAHCGPRLFGLIDTNGAQVVPHHYSWIGEAHDGCRSIARGQPNILGELPKEADWGVLGADGELLLEPSAECVRNMAQGRAAVQRNGTWNLLTTEGTWLLDAEGTQCGNFHGGLCPLAIDDRWGFVDLHGRFVIDPIYEGAGEFRDGLAGVRLPGAAGWSYIDATGAVVSEVEVDVFHWHSNGFARAQRGGKWGFIDSSGRIAIPFELDEAYDFHSGIAAVRIGQGWTWIDTAGAPISDERFDKTFNASEGLGIFEEGPFRGYIRTDGPVLARGVEGAFNMQEGLAPVQKRARWGFLNLEGELVAKHRFSSVLAFSEGLAAVKSAGKWGFIDTSGTMAILPKLGTPGSFHCGRARVHR